MRVALNFQRGFVVTSSDGVDESNQCIVFGAAMSLARDHWGDRFREKQADEAASIARRAKKV